MRQEEIDALLEKIRNSAEDMPTPERLEPERMMEKLRALEPKEADSEEAKESKRKPKWQKPIRYGAAAAVLALTLITAAQWKNVGIIGEPVAMQPLTSGKDPEAVKEETAAGTNVSEEELLTEPKEAKEYIAKSYKEIYKRLEDHMIDRRGDPGMGMLEGVMVAETTAAAAATMAAVPEAGAAPGSSGPGAAPGLAGAQAGNNEMKSNAGAADSASPDFSDTNVQVEGVDEGDIVKTDGRYIYRLSEDRGRIQIVEAADGALKKMGMVSDTSTATISKSVQEFYVDGDTLLVIRQAHLPYEISADEYVVACYAYPRKSVTYLETYDISDKENPKLAGTVTQDGTYKSSRKTGDYLYLFTGYYASELGSIRETETYVPQVNKKVIPYDDIYIPEHVKSPGYLVITATDIRKPKTPVSSKAVLAEGDCFYVSPENIYIGTTKYDGKASQYNYTELMKLSYKNGKVAFRAHANIDGSLNNQFSLDEHQGYLRMVTTLSYNQGKTTNSLIVLDQDLKKTAEITDLAPGEQIYSARFMGDTGYFVTFRNIDPLFSVDLSDPADPKILGELKITGFSEYLHSWSEDLLFGIGREMDPNSGVYKGLKLSMFDVSDLTDVKETQKMVEAAFENSPAWENHKAVMISPGRNLIGFVVEHYEDRVWGWQYVVYRYDREKGFVQEMIFELPEYYESMTARGLYIGSWFYVVEHNRITSFDLKDFQQTDQLKY